MNVNTSDCNFIHGMYIMHKHGFKYRSVSPHRFFTSIRIESYCISSTDIGISLSSG
jgi:hypothetical protein